MVVVLCYTIYMNVGKSDKSAKLQQQIRLTALEALISQIVNKYPHWMFDCPAEEEKALLFFADESARFVETYKKDYTDRFPIKREWNSIIQEIDKLRSDSLLGPLYAKYNVDSPHFFEVVGDPPRKKQTYRK